MKIGALICAYNEEKHISEVVSKSLKHLKNVIVVNDGSSDNTLKELKKTKARIINFKKNQGKGVALRKGFQYAIRNKFDYLILLDGDSQHDPDEIPKFLEQIKAGYDLIIGSRKRRGSNMPYLRRFTNFSTSLLLSAKMRKWIKDTQSGYRAINVKFLKNLNLRREKYDLETELLIKVIRRGAKVTDVTIKTIYGDEKSSINPVRDTARFLSLLFSK